MIFFSNNTLATICVLIAEKVIKIKGYALKHPNNIFFYFVEALKITLFSKQDFGKSARNNIDL